MKDFVDRQTRKLDAEEAVQRTHGKFVEDPAKPIGQRVGSSDASHFRSEMRDYDNNRRKELKIKDR